MLYSLPIASSVRSSPLLERPKRSTSTRRERSGSSESSSLLIDLGWNWTMFELFDYYDLCGVRFSKILVLRQVPLPIHAFSTDCAHLQALRHFGSKNLLC